MDTCTLAAPPTRAPRAPAPMALVLLALALLALALLALALLAALPGKAHAGNLDGFLLSNEAVMTGGAITATTGDAGSTWYNPAGLAKSRRAKVSLSGSAFAFHLRRAPGGMITTFPDERQERDLDSNDILTVPSALAIVRAFGDDLTAAFGVFVPEQDRYALSGVLTRVVTIPQQAGKKLDLQFNQLAQASAVTQRYNIGVGFGYSLSDSLRLGATLFTVYRTEQVDSRFAVEVDGSPSPLSLFTVGQSSLERTHIGVELTAGLQWQPIETLHLGLLVRSPRLRIQSTQSGEGFLATAKITQDKPDADFVYDDSFQEEEEGVGAAAPLRVVGAAALGLGGGFLALEGDYRPAWQDEQVAVINARLGLTLPVSKTTSWGVGVFTDRSPQKTPAAFPQARVDFYGLSLGLHHDTPVGLEVGEEAESLVFSSTFGLRYAVGLGQMYPVRFSMEPGDAATLSLKPAELIDVTWHEVALHVGSGLRF